MANLEATIFIERAYFVVDFGPEFQYDLVLNDKYRGRYNISEWAQGIRPIFSRPGINTVQYQLNGKSRLRCSKQEVSNKMNLSK